MSFVSTTFAVFYALVLLIRLTIGRDNRSPLFLNTLLLVSLAFYCWHEPSYIALILISGITDYVAARLIVSSRRDGDSSGLRILIVSLVINLGLLGFFKYAGFLTETAAMVFDVSDALQMSAADILLPIGISFYTFQSMSYSIDVYRNQLQAESRFTRLMLYVCFFPQLVAGPIVRASQFFYQLDRRRLPRLIVFTEGTYLIIRGLFFKMVIADNIGVVVDSNWEAATEPGKADAMVILLGFLFTCQIFADFRGYTDIARGIAYQLGFRLPINFNAPYLAHNFSNFWRRWHITLSAWMRDYIYLSLGGNRKGLTLMLFNLFVVMVISGLWHGAAMNFVLWGAIHGIAIVIERVFRLNSLNAIPAVLSWYLVVQLTWLLGMIVFRATSGDQGLAALSNVYLGLSALPELPVWSIPDLRYGLIFAIPVVLSHLRSLATERNLLNHAGRNEKALMAGVMLLGLTTLYAPTTGFIYFQF